MTTEREKNQKRIESIAEKLSSLLPQVVFLGGSVVGFLLTDQAAPDVRPTMDVDIIIGVKTTREYHKLSEKLESLGFKDERSVICRWTINDHIVDVMPNNKGILGHSNRWYPLAMETAYSFPISKNLNINLINPPCFIATKVHAFEIRGKQDFLLSKDLNDIVYVINGRPEIVDEINSFDKELKKYVSQKLKKYLKNEYFLQAIQGFLDGDTESQERYDIIMNRLQKIAGT